MSKLSSRAARLLEAIVVGDRSADEDEVVRLARDDALFRARLEELLEVTQLLEATSRDALEIRQAAQEWRDAPGEHTLQETLGLGRAESVPTRSRRSVRLSLLAAALVAAAGLLWFFQPRPPAQVEPSERVRMGTERVELLDPSRADGAAGLRVIAWRGSLPGGGEYRIRVSDASAGAPASEPLLEARTTETRWTLSEEETQRLPRRVWIEIGVHARDGRRLGGDSLFFER